jgi:hypothetical protein
MMQLWEDLYEPGLYSDLWYRFKGKPLLICHDKRAIPDEIRDFFTWRMPIWGGPTGPLQWAWEGNPPAVACDAEGNAEQMAISVCANACDYPSDDPRHGSNMSDGYWGFEVHGRSWHHGKKDERENAAHYGFHIGEQMELALEKDPPVVFICQWNEWLVPFLTTGLVGAPSYKNHGHDICFRDEFDLEYSRDIEPMKGGYKDAFYLQMASFVRKFKGMEPPAVDCDYTPLQMNGDFSQWEGNGIAYREYVGDVRKRDCKGYDDVGRYVNDTGNHEFSLLKVASDSTHLYFYAECVKEITPWENERWMNLYLTPEGTSCPAWEGYSYLLRRHPDCKDRYVVERCAKSGEYAWERIGFAEFSLAENKLAIKVSKDLLGVTEEDFSLAFKWSDNMQERDVMDFYVNGDCAPRGRMNYVYLFRKSGAQ